MQDIEFSESVSSCMRKNKQVQTSFSTINFEWVKHRNVQSAHSHHHLWQVTINITRTLTSK
jgi:hypothetical protein